MIKILWDKYEHLRTAVYEKEPYTGTLWSLYEASMKPLLSLY
jgi:hypothetical protein